jgi:arylsulfatase A-like enzyme
MVNRKSLISICVALALLNFLHCFLIKNDKKLNFVFILVDDLGWRDLGCYGSTFYETPNIDLLAEQGMQFTNAYAACSVCSPTRASIMNGKYPARMNTTDWFGAPQPNTVQNHWTRNKPLLPAPYDEQLSLDEITLGEAFNEAGYRTFFAGKWHLGGKGFYPEDQGFDINRGGHERGSPPGGYFSPYKNPKLLDGEEGEHLPDRLTDECVAFLEKTENNPFLLFLSFYSVHTPLEAQEELVRKYEEKASLINHQDPHFLPEGERQVRQVQNHAVYAAMVESMDKAIGKVINALDRLELSNQTAVIFMSDNGGLSTSEGSPTSNLPLRAGKGWLYEGGIREPMIIKWPGTVTPGSVCEEKVISTDFYPTMLEMAGLPLKPNQHLDGESFLPQLILKKQMSPRAIFWHYPHYGNQGGSPGAAVRIGDFKLIHFFEDNRIELYNIKDDIGESDNLVEELPEKRIELLSLLQQWQKEVGARMPSPNPKYKKKVEN